MFSVVVGLLDIGPMSFEVAVHLIVHWDCMSVLLSVVTQGVGQRRQLHRGYAFDGERRFWYWS